jgi:hypothetical protein
LSSPALPDQRKQSLHQLHDLLRSCLIRSIERSDSQCTSQVTNGGTILHRTLSSGGETALLWQLGTILQAMSIDFSLLRCVLECLHLIWRPVRKGGDAAQPGYDIRRQQYQSVEQHFDGTFQWFLYVLQLPSIPSRDETSSDKSSSPGCELVECKTLVLDVLRCWVQLSSAYDRISKHRHHSESQKPHPAIHPFDPSIAPSLRQIIVNSPLVSKAPCILETFLDVSQSIFRYQQAGGRLMRLSALGLVKDLSFRLDGESQHALYQCLGKAVFQIGAAVSTAKTTGCSSEINESNDENQSLNSRWRESSPMPEEKRQTAFVPSNDTDHQKPSGRLGVFPGDEVSIREEESIAAILWNWSCTTGNLTETLGGNVHFWSALKRCCGANSVDETALRFETRQEATHEALLPTRRNSTSALGSVVAFCSKASTATGHGCESASRPPNSSSTRSAVELLVVQHWVPGFLLRALRKENDEDWRRRSLRTVRCLLASPWGLRLLRVSSGSSGIQPKFDEAMDWVKVLVPVLHVDKEKVKACRVDSIVQTCNIFSLLIPEIERTTWVAMGPYIETALTQTILDLNPDSITQQSFESDRYPFDKALLAACATLTACLRNSPWSRGSSQYVGPFQDRIRALLLRHSDDASYHLVLSDLLFTLVHDDLRKELEIQDTSQRQGVGSSLLNSAILDTLTTLVSSVGPDFKTSRTQALATIDLFTKHPWNASKLGAHEDLMTGIVNFCLISTGAEKDRAKGILLDLVQLL